jgi:hypothetical protein
MHRALSAQWAAQKARLAVAEGKDPGPVGEGGREYDDDALAEYEGAKTELDYANWLRSKEIADFFSRTRCFRPAGQQKPARTRRRESAVFRCRDLVGQAAPLGAIVRRWKHADRRGNVFPSQGLDTYV